MGRMLILFIFAGLLVTSSAKPYDSKVRELLRMLSLLENEVNGEELKLMARQDTTPSGTVNPSDATSPGGSSFNPGSTTQQASVNPSSTVAASSVAPGSTTQHSSTVQQSTQQPSTQAPTTQAPTTQAPTTTRPTTLAPTTLAPTTKAPTTTRPTTLAPTTQAPTTTRPTTLAPTTTRPTTLAPTTTRPTTLAPTTKAPTTTRPTTLAPTTTRPTTLAPTTQAPTTTRPTTLAPTTQAPTTQAQTTQSQTTARLTTPPTDAKLCRPGGVVFSAIRTKDITKTGDITFDKTLVNLGKAFKNPYFEAPCNGLYRVEMNFEYGYSLDESYVEIVKDGSVTMRRLIANQCDCSGKVFEFSQLVQLEFGQRLWLRFDGKNNIGKYHYFAITLLESFD